MEGKLGGQQAVTCILKSEDFLAHPGLETNGICRCGAPVSEHGTSSPFRRNKYKFTFVLDHRQLAYSQPAASKEFNDFYLNLVECCSDITRDLVKCPIDAFSEGLYQRCLYHELRSKFKYNTYLEVEINLEFRGHVVSHKRMDIFVKLDNLYVILELKATKGPATEDAKKQLRNYVICVNHHKDIAFAASEGNKRAKELGDAEEDVGKRPVHYLDSTDCTHGLIVVFHKEPYQGELFSIARV